MQETAKQNDLEEGPQSAVLACTAASPRSGQGVARRLRGSRKPPGAGGPELRYAGDARRRFRSGDVLLFRGKGFISWAICKLTGSHYSHAGLSYVFEGRVYCLEAVGSGVRLVLMSQLVKRYKGGIEYFEHSAASEKQRGTAISFGFQQLGKLYDKPGILRFLWAILTRRMRNLRRDEQWFCSELVVAAFLEAGVPLLDSHPEGYTSPADVAASDRLVQRFWVRE